MSEEDIAGGNRWTDSLAEALDRCDFGIICLTQSNQRSPWLLFEAGALAKRMQTGRVVPLCIDFPVGKLKGPFGLFQGRPMTKEGLKRLVADISQAFAEPLGPRTLNLVFDAGWSYLEAAAQRLAPTRY